MTHIELTRGFKYPIGISVVEEQGDDGQFHVVPKKIPGDFRWRMVHTNGNVVAASTEGYADRRDMLYNLQLVTGGKFDHSGTVLKRPRKGVGRATIRWERFEVHDKTKEQ